MSSNTSVQLAQSTSCRGIFDEWIRRREKAYTAGVSNKLVCLEMLVHFTILVVVEMLTIFKKTLKFRAIIDR